MIKIYYIGKRWLDCARNKCYKPIVKISQIINLSYLFKPLSIIQTVLRQQYFAFIFQINSVRTKRKIPILSKWTISLVTGTAFDNYWVESLMELEYELNKVEMRSTQSYNYSLLLSIYVKCYFSWPRWENAWVICIKDTWKRNSELWEICLGY